MNHVCIGWTAELVERRKSMLFTSCTFILSLFMPKWLAALSINFYDVQNQSVRSGVALGALYPGIWTSWMSYLLVSRPAGNDWALGFRACASCVVKVNMGLPGKSLYIRVCVITRGIRISLQIRSCRQLIISAKTGDYLCSRFPCQSLIEWITCIRT